jgi:hypothetical protein
MCFEILGFDVLIDDKLKPWLIEINHAPSFATDTPFDFKIKKDVVADAIQLLGMTYKRKKRFIKSFKSHIANRTLKTKQQGPLKATKQQSSVQSPKQLGKEAEDALESEEEEEENEYEN